jgi:O-antigen/teichoic acid export membrane protein
MEALIMDTVISALQILLIVIFWHFNVISAANVFIAMAAASFTGGLGAFLIHRKDFEFALSDIKKDTLENIRFGKWLMAGSFFHLGSLYLFPWIIYSIAGETKAGAFAACYTLVNLINPFILGFNNYFRPHVMQTYSREGLEAMHTLIMRVTIYFIPVALVISGFLALFGGWLVEFVYGEEFANLGPVIAIVGISVIPVILNAPIQLATLAINRPQINPKFHSAAFVSTLFIGVPLVVYFETTGAAIGYSTSVTVGFLALVYFYKKELTKLRLQLKNTQ